MKYRFYDVDTTSWTTRTIMTRSGKLPISAIARTLRDLAFKRFGNAGYIVPDQSIVGGYYRDADGDTIAVELDFSL